MVERLKDAIEKARSRRAAGGEPAASAAAPAPRRPLRPQTERGAIWERLAPLAAETGRSADPRIASAQADSRTRVSFDLLRTRLLKACQTHGWRRIAVTSPYQGCGKSFVTLNLALSLARNPEARIALIEFDLKRPSLARSLGARREIGATAFLRGEAATETAFATLAPNLAALPCEKPVAGSAELLNSVDATSRLDEVQTALDTSLMLFDLPPVLLCDDVIAFIHNVDAVLLVAAAGETRASGVAECERLLADHAPIAGVILNKVEGADLPDYGRSYGGYGVSD